MKRGEPVTIGLVGQSGAGKGEVSKYLQKKGFAAYSLSDSLRNVASSLNQGENREVLINLGATLRENFGQDILARGALRWHHDNKVTRGVIDSIRHPAEIQLLKQELGIVVMAVVASDEIRFKLMQQRGRDNNPKTWADFRQLSRKERGDDKTPDAQNLNECFRMLDIQVANTGTIRDLRNYIRRELASKGIKLR